MNLNIIGFIISLVFVSFILAIAAAMNKTGKLSAEGSRKLIHIGVANWWLIAMFFFDSIIWAIAVPLIFVGINLYSHYSGAISAMEREGKKSLGTVFYPVSLTILAIFCFGGYSEPYIGALGILIMGWGDGLAALAGLRFGRKKSGKTLAGSLCMLVVSFLVSVLVLRVYSPDEMLIKSLLLAIFATVVEALSSRGADNLTVPLMTAAFYQFILR